MVQDESPGPAAGHHPRQQRAILAVEDDPDIMSLLSDVLADEGYQVVPARRGEDAVDVAQSTPIGLMLLDLGLPDLHGNDVLVRLKSNPATSDVPIIVITANPQDLRNASFVEAVIAKPFDLHDVLFEIENVLSRFTAENKASDPPA
jgi:two-component system KDP operon response regulator KdpE